MSGQQSKLIVVEGLSGSGKSSTAQYLSIALEKNGQTARWYSESESENPVKAWYTPQWFTSPSEYRKHITHAWREFATSIDSGNSVSVVDGCLLQSTLFGLVHYDIERSLIRNVLQEIFDALRRAPATLIYLRNADPVESLKSACRTRYPALLAEYIARNDASEYCRKRALCGEEGLRSFMIELRNLSDEILGTFPGSKLILEADLKWAERYQLILKHFSLVESVLAVPDIKKFTGRYLRKTKSGVCEFEVRLEDGQLVVYGLAPYLWNSGNKLIPKCENVFYAASWPTEVVFDVSGNDILSLRLNCRDQERRTNEVFSKVK